MIHRTALFVGVSLAAAGIVMLVGLGDTAAGEVLIESVRLWPLAIVALGVGLLVRRTRFAVVGTLVAATLAGVVVGGAVVDAPNLDTFCTDRDAAGAPTRTGTLTTPATVDLMLACGDVDIATVDGTAWELRTLELGGRSAIVAGVSTVGMWPPVLSAFALVIAAVATAAAAARGIRHLRAADLLRAQ